MSKYFKLFFSKYLCEFKKVFIIQQGVLLVKKRKLKADYW